MNLRILLLTLFIFNFGYSQNGELSETHLKLVQNIISIFKVNDVDVISDCIEYPVSREYPLPRINNAAELKSRFDEIFDEKLINTIVNSKPEQWAEVGWRGIMLLDGLIWIDGEDGKITTVNYQSEFEKDLQEKIIYNDTKVLYPSLREFESPLLKILTLNHLIRIDELATGKMRYAAWKSTEDESLEPDLVLVNGEMEIQGTGGNFAIVFTNDNYTYTIFRNFIGDQNRPDATLVVERNGQIILAQDGILKFD